MMNCPYCGSDVVDYVGIDDGGDWDSQVCDVWRCLDCQHEFECDCVDVGGYWDE